MAIKWDLILIAVIYVVGLTIGVGWYVRHKGQGKTTDSFLFADRSLTPLLGGASVGMCAVGALHTTGLMETGMTAGMVVGVWLAAMSAISFAFECCFFVPFFRKMKIVTIPDTMGKMFREKNKLLFSCTNILVMFLILAIESQGGGILISAMTGIDMWISIVIFMIMCVLYVLIAGLHQVAVLNLVNVIIMYVIIVITFLIVGGKLPGGWAGVEAFYVNSGEAIKLSMFPDSIGGWLALPVPLLIACFIMNPMDQGKMAYYLAAKDTRTSYKMGFIGVSFNAPFGMFPLVLGIAAGSIALYAGMGEKVGTIHMLIDTCPSVLIGLVLAAFLAIVISTWGRFTMGIAQIITNDFYIRFSKKHNQKKELFVSRLTIIVAGLLALIPAFAMPSMIMEFLFICSLIAPTFFCLMLGLFWKRNSNAAFVSVIVAIVCSCIWHYGNVGAAIGFPFWWVAMYTAIVVSIVLYIVLTLALPGTEQSYVSMMRQKDKVSK